MGILGFGVFYAVYASLGGTPVSVAVMHVWYLGLREHPGEIVCKNIIRPLFLLFLFFC